jgi:hypothetical protein
LYDGTPTTSRNEPSAFGRKVIRTVNGSTTDADTSRARAVNAATAPVRLPEVVSRKVSARAATAPVALAVGVRPSQSLRSAVWVLPGSAPVTSRTNWSASARTYERADIPPPRCTSCPSYIASRPV